MKTAKKWNVDEGVMRWKRDEKSLALLLVRAGGVSNSVECSETPCVVPPLASNKPVLVSFLVGLGHLQTPTAFLLQVLPGQILGAKVGGVGQDL